MKVTQQPHLPTPAATTESRSVERSAKTERRSAAVADRAPAAGSGSLVELSDDAKLLQQGVELTKKVPTDRPQHLSQIKKSVREGTYKVDSRAVADRLVDEYLANELAKGKA